MSNWQSLETVKPSEGQECWISDGIVVCWAIYRSTAHGGWANEDTWEDFDCEYKYWQPANPPLPPKKH